MPKRAWSGTSTLSSTGPAATLPRPCGSLYPTLLIRIDGTLSTAYAYWLSREADLRRVPFDCAAQVLGGEGMVMLGQPTRRAEEPDDVIDREQRLERGAEFGGRAVATEERVAVLGVVDRQDADVPTHIAGTVVGPVD